MSDEISSLAQLWVELKEIERKAVQDRREIEDQIKSKVGLDESFEGLTKIDTKNVSIKITSRIDRKVDADKLQEIAVENGLSEHLGNLFRWNAEINMAAWKGADEKITKPLLSAVTSKPGRPSFTITKKED